MYNIKLASIRIDPDLDWNMIILLFLLEWTLGKLNCPSSTVRQLSHLTSLDCMPFTSNTNNLINFIEHRSLIVHSTHDRV
uniref:Uncharacterized protein n=1 Tax=Rhizophora mucronata TaxID=61149 RepID=A0A2P2P3G9_RHIMU